MFADKGYRKAFKLFEIDEVLDRRQSYHVSQRRKEREQISLRLDRVSAKKGVKTRNTPELASLAIG